MLIADMPPVAEAFRLPTVDPAIQIQEALGVDEQAAQDYMQVVIACPGSEATERQTTLGEFMGSAHGQFIGGRILEAAKIAHQEGAESEDALRRALGPAAIADQNTGLLQRERPAAVEADTGPIDAEEPSKVDPEPTGSASVKLRPAMLAANAAWQYEIEEISNALVSQDSETSLAPPQLPESAQPRPTTIEVSAPLVVASAEASVLTKHNLPPFISAHAGELRLEHLTPLPIELPLVTLATLSQPEAASQNVVDEPVSAFPPTLLEEPKTTETLVQAELDPYQPAITLEKLQAIQPTPNAPTWEVLQTEAQEALPLEQTFVTLAECLTVAPEIVPEVVPELLAEIILLIPEHRNELTGEPELTPDITAPLIELLELLGYEEPENTFMQFIESYGLESLLQIISELHAIQSRTHEDVWHEFLLTSLQSTDDVDNKHVWQRIGRALLGALENRGRSITYQLAA